jgi:hypothetical protein
MIPPPFRTLRALEVLNIGAVALALAGVTGVVLTLAVHNAGADGAISAFAGAPTLVCGLLWAWLLRRPATVGESSIRWGWVASIPLAMANAGLTLSTLVALTSSVDLGKGLFAAFLGATFGAIVWVPALLATLVCFGLPIAWAQRLAKKGLAGEERGEWIVGLVCALMSLVGLIISYVWAPKLRVGGIGGTGIGAPRLIALLGLVAGVASTTLARAREARRRAFVADAEAGKIVGYRIDATDEGKVLVRVVSQGKGYRVADFEEEVFELDAEGEATRPTRAKGVAAP